MLTPVLSATGLPQARLPGNKEAVEGAGVTAEEDNSTLIQRINARS